MDENAERERELELIGDMKGAGINQLVFQLMHRYSSMNFSKFQNLGVHPGQLPVFVALRKQEGISLREMAELLHIKPPTVTVTVQRLERAGFVCKKPDEKDQRISRIYLTEKGKNLSEGIYMLIAQGEQILTEGFSGEEVCLLKDFLRRMIDNLVQAAGTGTECQRNFSERPPFAGGERREFMENCRDFPER